MALTLEQLRAADALAKVRSLQDRSDSKYRSYVQALPATIVMNGLGQAAATLLAAAKGNPKADHRILHDHLQDWLLHQAKVFPHPAATLIDALTGCDQDTYVRAQGEALAYLVWLKKFSQAYLKEARL